MKSYKLKKIVVALTSLSTLNLILAANVPSTNNVNTRGKALTNTNINASSSMAANLTVTRHLFPSNNPNTNQNESNQSVLLNSDKVILNFEGADIQSVIKAISKLSGQNFVIDPRVKGTVNIVSDRPIAKADSYKVLESALRMQGFACVEGDGVIKVLPENDAKTYGMETILGKNSTYKPQIGDQIITKVFVIQHGSAMQLAGSLRQLIAPNNAIAVYPNSNALIVSDYASNINRIGKIINRLSEVENVSQPTVVMLQNAVAADVAQMLQAYLGGGSLSGSGGGGGGFNSDGPMATITVDPTSNSIIIYSPIQDKVNELKTLAEKIDQNTGAVHSDLHVVYLRNADAEHVADVLRTIAENQEDPSITASSSLAKFATEPSSTFSSPGGSGSTGGGSSSGGSGISPSTSSRSSSKPGGNNAANQKDAPKIIIQAEPTTNSLIIQAPQAVYKNLRMLIQMLDIRRAQVMIEAMVADISSTTAGNFGIQWIGGLGNNNGGVGVISNYGGTSVTNGGSNSVGGLVGSVAAGATTAGSGGTQTGAAAAAAGVANLPNEVYVGLVTGTVNVGGTNIPTISALADAIEANNVGNVITRPTLLTLDNEEARIMVGENVGIQNGSFQNTANSAGGVVNTITRQDLGDVLQIKPLITQSGAIQLDVYQEQSGLAPGTPSNDANPTFSERKLRATILVNDGQIIALGGETTENIALVKSGIPLLSDIPYLGWLFSWQSREEEKENLVLFLRPVIIKNAEGLAALSNPRYKYVVDQQSTIQAKGNLLLPGVKPVTLDDQIPYDNGKIQAQMNNGGSSLNLDNSLPILDLTAGGKNVTRSQINNAVGVTTTNVTNVPIEPGISSLNTMSASNTMKIESK